MAIMDLPFLNLFKTKKSHKELVTLCSDWGANIAFKNYAIQLALNKIANSLALCDFQTFEKNKLIQGENWWKLNYEPNPNQNQIDFWNKALERMVYDDNGALVFQSKEGYLVVAEDYEIEEFSFKENIYHDILLPGELVLKGSYTESQVIRLKLNNSKVKSVIDSVYDEYGKLLAGTIRNYNRGNSIKLMLKIDAMFDQFKKTTNPETGESEYDQILDDIFENRFKGIFSDSDSATPLESGLSVETIETSKNTKSGGSTTRDITAIFDDIVNLVADAFNIPRGILKGDVADAEAITDNFITFCIRPLADEIQSEFNRKMYGKKNVQSGSKLKIKTDKIRTYDPVKFANAAEALLRIGTYTPNMVKEKLDEEQVNELWANEHYVTKNYEKATEPKGGDFINEEDTNKKSN